MYYVNWFSRFVLAFSLVSTATATAQDEPAPKPNAATLSSRFIPDDATASLFIFPQELLEEAGRDLLPAEVARAWTMEKVGVDLADIHSLVLIAGVPGPAGFEFGIGVTLQQNFDFKQLGHGMIAGPAVSLGGFESYPLLDSPELFLHQIDSRTVAIATRRYLPKMLSTDEGAGPLPKLVATTPKSAPVVAAAVVEPARRQLNQALYGIRNQLPLPLDGATRVPELLDAAVVAVDILPEHQVRLTMIGRDEASAAELEKIIFEALPFIREFVVTQSTQQLQDQNAVAEATRSYIERLIGDVVTMLTPHREGRQLRINIEDRGGLARSTAVASLLLPTVQAYGEAVQRVRTASNLEQIMLALHHYWDAFKRLPDPALRDAEGNPLLSWRVAILPFMGQAELYAEFRLDEPWDSEHNAKLIDCMPGVFKDPSVATPPGQTVYQAAVGEDLAFAPQGMRRFQDIGDGLSNTIALVEADVAVAVPWTKPSDVEIDLENPLQNIGNNRQAGFFVAYANGRIRFIADTAASAVTVDPDIFRAHLTRLGGEVVPRLGEQVDGGSLSSP